MHTYTHTHTHTHTHASLLCPPQHTLIHWLLKLACASLSFDFIGTTTDESSDDLATVQIPTAWRPLFLDYSTLQLFFGLFHSLPHKLAATVSVTNSVGIRTQYWYLCLLLAGK